MNLKSIRWQLPLSYAGIALLAALALGMILLITLRDYYERLERSNLLRNAERIRLSLAPVLEAGVPISVLEAQVKSLALFADARIRVMDPAGIMIVDSGLPAGLDMLAFAPLQEPIEPSLNLPRLGEQLEGQAPLLRGFQRDRQAPFTTPISPATPQAPVDPVQVVEPLPEPGIGGVYLYAQPVTTGVLTSTVEMVVGGYGLILPIRGERGSFSFDLGSGEARRSQQEARLPVLSSVQGFLGTLLLSDAPAYGSRIVNSVMHLWMIAGLAAVLLAAGVGWLVSRRVTVPLAKLTGVTTRMAGGDLSARADSRPEDEFGALARSFNEMASRVEETVLALRRFVSDAAHELQTPLTALRINLELVEGEEDPQQLTEALQRAQAQVDRLSAVTQGLLDLSRLEAGVGVQSQELIELAPLALRVSERYAAQAEQNGQEFELTLAPDTPPILGNVAQMERVLSNLLDNALKFTPAGGTVRLGLAEVDGMVLLWVEDSGIGIPAEDLEGLFGRFHRGRNASAYPGSGLGLAIVKTIVEAHGGRVRAENQPEGGARFNVYLPVQGRSNSDS